MASHDSAKKSIRKTIKQKAINASRMSRMKTFVKKLEAAINNKESATQIQQAFSAMQKELMKGAAKNVIHKNTASRKISRMSLRVKAALSSNK